MKWLWLLLFVVSVADAAEVRYADVVYLDELGISPVELHVVKRTPISASRNLMSAQGYLPKGLKIRLVGWGKEAYLVEGQVATGPVRGWVSPKAMEAPAPEAVNDWQQRQTEQERRRQLIAQHEIVTGMTREEVLASLGKPDRMVSGRVAGLVEDRWFYTIYRYMPAYQHDTNAAGESRQSVSYQRVPTGQRVVVFQGRTVVRLDEGAGGKSLPEANQ